MRLLLLPEGFLPLSLLRWGLLSFWVFCVAGCAAPARVDVYLTRITPMPSTLFEQRARLDLRIQNLGEVPIEAAGMKVALQLNGKRLARGVDAGAFTIPRLGEATTSVIVSSSVFDTIKQVLGIRGVDKFSYALSGQVVTPGPNKRFTRKGEISRAELQPLLREQ